MKTINKLKRHLKVWLEYYIYCIAATIFVLAGFILLYHYFG